MSDAAIEPDRQQRNRVGLFLPPCLAERIGKVIENVCTYHGFSTHSFGIKGSYVDNYSAQDNVVTWSMNMNHAWYMSKNKNVLFLDSSRLVEQSGLYMDHGGYYSNSAIRFAPYNPSNVDWTVRFAKDVLNVDIAQSNGNKNGPILIALQRTSDTGSRHYFPAKEGDSISTMLRLARRYLPSDRKVIVRPHPRHTDEWKKHRETYLRELAPDWKVSWKGSAPQILSKCSSVVTINSTIANEALLRGLPVAMLGKDISTGSGAVLDCSTDPSRLSDITRFESDSRMNLAYLHGVMRAQVNWQPSASELCRHPSFITWFRRIGQCAT